MASNGMDKGGAVMDKVMPIRIIERSMPARINTKLIAGWETEHGTLCTGCNEVLPYPFAECKCSHELQEETNENVRGIYQM